MCQLPDLLTFDDATPVRDAADWSRRRAELLEPLLAIEYGHLPPEPTTTRGELLNANTPKRFVGARAAQYRVVCELPAGVCSFRLDLTWPGDAEPCPVILYGDACWRYRGDDILRLVLKHGYMLAEFSRVEIVPDIGPEGRSQGLHRLCDGDFGAIAAWAWGYHRCVDVLSGLDAADAERIAVVGHSRGGKTSLLAGATDERIALTGSNGSGCGGAGCFRHEGRGAERLENIIERFPHWFAPGLEQYAGRQEELPFDQHALKAAVAPRALLTTEALEDLWANPTGTWVTHAAAREVYALLGVADRIGISYRPGAHRHDYLDWQALVEFADGHFRGITPGRAFNHCPFATA
ncbi:MAG: alpha/beta hydrolase family protein [Planctomycetota bacterium]